MEDMIVKSSKDESHDQYPNHVFKRVRKYNTRLNPEKCTFEMITGNFIGFYATERGIKANPDKYEAVI